jgi:hypothetical protein
LLRSILWWTCRIVLGVYCVLVVSSYWSMLSDLDTTARLVGSEVGCSISVVQCNWLAFGIDQIVGVVVIGSAVAALFAVQWRNRYRALIVAALAAVAHLAVLQVLLNPT